MSKHDHPAPKPRCEHTGLAYCKPCDVVYCTACDREWAEKKEPFDWRALQDVRKYSAAQEDLLKGRPPWIQSYDPKLGDPLRPRLTSTPHDHRSEETP